MIAVLCSGGMDSTVLAHMAHNRGDLAGLIFVDYTQPVALYEAGASGALSFRLNVPWRLVRAEVPGVRSMSLGAGADGPRVVGGRNLILIAHAVGVCQQMGWDTLWVGMTRDDWEDYPDCRLPFLGGIQAAADVYGVKVRAPLVEERAADIRARGDALGVDWSGVWSCYEATPDGQQCGACVSCQRLNTATDAAGAQAPRETT